MLAKENALEAAFGPGLAAIWKLLDTGKEGLYNVGKHVKRSLTLSLSRALPLLPIPVFPLFPFLALVTVSVISFLLHLFTYL